MESQRGCPTLGVRGWVSLRVWHPRGEESFSAWSAFESDGAQCQPCQEQKQRCKKDAASPHDEILLTAQFPVAFRTLP